MKIRDYSILRVEQKSDGFNLFWREEHSIAHKSFNKGQMDILLKQADVHSAGELLGHTIIAIKSENRRVVDDTKYVCIPKGADFQIQVKLTVVENDGKLTEAQAV